MAAQLPPPGPDAPPDAAPKPPPPPKPAETERVQDGPIAHGISRTLRTGGAHTSVAVVLLFSALALPVLLRVRKARPFAGLRAGANRRRRRRI